MAGSEERNVPDSVKPEVERAAAKPIEKILKPGGMNLPPKNMQFDYLVATFPRW